MIRLSASLVAVLFAVPLACPAAAQDVTATVKHAVTSVEVVEGYFREYALDHTRSGPAIVDVDEFDNVWVGLARSGKLARFANGGVTLFEIGEDSRPVGVVADRRDNGRAGTIWIAAAFDDKIVRFDSHTNEIQVFEVPGDSSWPFIIDVGPKGYVWFTQRAAGRIGRLDPATGTVKHYPVPTEDAGPAGMAVDQTTGAVWFTQSTADRVGVLDPDTGHVRQYIMGDESTGMVSGPGGLALDAEGGVWFAKLDDQLGYIGPGSQTIELVDMPEQARRPAGIAVGPKGDVWALALDSSMIVRYKPAERAFVIYPLPTGATDPEPDTPPTARTSRPFGLAFDGQGNLWVSEQYTGQLAVLDLAPPELVVLSPGPSVVLADPLLTIRALDRVAGVRGVTVRLDGRPAVVRHGRLLLDAVAPGTHELRITATDGAGFSTTVVRRFEYRPGNLAIAQILRGLHPTDADGAALKQSLIDGLESISPKADLSLALTALHQQLKMAAGHFQGIDWQAFDATIRFASEHAAHNITISILDGPPYFSSSEIRVRVGDRVVWRYDPAMVGHRLPSSLHRIRIAAMDLSSPLIKAGETFSHRFLESGTYRIEDIEQSAASAIIRVSER